MSKTIPQSVWC